MHDIRLPLGMLIGLTLIAAACAPELTAEQEARLRDMALSAEDPLPASPTNGVADDLQAAQLGRLIFFDERMSSDGEVSCASCHEPDRGWSDPRAVSRGVDGNEGGRHSMPVHSIAHQNFFFWDGRADSVWSQTLQAIESEAEMDFTRAEVAHYVADHRRADYEAIFGPMPDLSSVPRRATAGDAAWEALSAQTKRDVERVFTNVGKVLEAYQRQLNCGDTRFDQWARGEVSMTRTEEIGAAVFVQERCIDCHSGVTFSDGEFHNLGLPSRENGDTGRQQGLASLLDNPFNGAGEYSDNTAAGTARLVEAMEENNTLGAFRTPTLRGVTQRRFFGHGSNAQQLGQFLEEAYDRNGGGGGDGRDRRRGGDDNNNSVGQIDPILRDVDADGFEEELVQFMQMLECRPTPAQWGPPSN